MKILCSQTCCHKDVMLLIGAIRYIRIKREPENISPSAREVELLINPNHALSDLGVTLIPTVCSEWLELTQGNCLHHTAAEAPFGMGSFTSVKTVLCLLKLPPPVLHLSKTLLKNQLLEK